MNVPCPIVNQITQIGNDGKAPEDGNEDCVPASLSSFIRAFNPTNNTTADGLHDVVYGQGYVGLQSPARYVSRVESYGLIMSYVSGAASDLVTRAAQELRAGHGVLLSIPSDWNNNPPHSPYAHMVAGCDTSGVSITCMNPWTARYETYPLLWWVERLHVCSYQGIWIIEKAQVPAVWHKNPDNTATDDKQHHVGVGIANEIFAHGWQSFDGLTGEEYYAPSASFAALSNGGVISWDGHAVHSDQAGQVLAQVWTLLQAAQQQPPAPTPPPPPPPAPSDPLAEEALATLQQLKATIGKL